MLATAFVNRKKIFKYNYLLSIINNKLELNRLFNQRNGKSLMFESKCWNT